MPYMLVGNCVHKQNDDGSAGEMVPGGCHDSAEEAKKHMQAMYANVNDSVVEMSLRITKASYNKSDDTPRRWAAIDSDIDEDLYREKMSLELYQDFEYRIKNNVPVPEPFRDIICEDAWCGGMPYLSIAHYKSGGDGKNLPGSVENVYIDGTRLKSKGTLSDTDLGRAVFQSLVDDIYKKKSDPTHLPVRISIGFLDLEHKHRAENGGQEFTFTRNNPGEICPLCAQGIGGKIYMKGQLVHLAMTRVPVNPRTAMEVERSMDIKTKKDDAASIIGELAETLDEKSLAGDVLVVRADEGSAPMAEHMELCDECYDPNTNSYNQECVDKVMEKYVGQPREDATVKSKALFDAVQKSLEKISGSQPVVEEKMEQVTNTQVAPAPVVSAGVTVSSGTVPEKGVMGIPEKKFEYAGISGDGNNNLPNPIKAKDEEGGAEDDAGDEMEKSFAVLRAAVKQAKKEGLAPEQYTQAINAAFANLGTVVENEFKPKSVAGSLDAQTLTEIVRAAIQPLQMEIATLKAQVAGTPAQAKAGVVKSKALNIGGQGLKPEDLIQRSVPAPQRKLTQIQQIALRSTGAIHE